MRLGKHQDSLHEVFHVTSLSGIQNSDDPQKKCGNDVQEELDLGAIHDGLRFLFERVREPYRSSTSSLDVDF